MTAPNNCQHDNIHWDDLFKEPKKNKAYCVDCGEVKGKIFARRVQSWYQKEIKQWLLDNKLIEKIGDYYSTFAWNEFLKKNNYDQQWNKLCCGMIDEDFEGLGNGVGGQIIFWETAKSIEQLCREFKQEKQDTPPPNPNLERERERESRKDEW